MEKTSSKRKPFDMKPAGTGAGGSSTFLRVVFSPVSQGIRLPTSFMKDYGHSLNAKTAVILTVPTGASWSVNLRQTDTGLWLDRGWQEFASYYEIKASHVLLFNYHGRAQFSVVIMDPSGLEIKYPMDDENDEEMPELDEKPVLVHAAVRGVEEKKQFDSYRKAEGFKSEKPFFLTFMQPSYVKDRYMVALNLSCAEDFLPKDGENSSCDLQVRVPGSNKVWRLSCHVYNGGRKSAVMKGWKEFAVDNKLCAADTCVFELVDPAALHFTVTIFRNT